MKRSLHQHERGIEGMHKAAGSIVENLAAARKSIEAREAPSEPEKKRRGRGTLLGSPAAWKKAAKQRSQEADHWKGEWRKSVQDSHETERRFHEVSGKLDETSGRLAEVEAQKAALEGQMANARNLRHGDYEKLKEAHKRVSAEHARLSEECNLLNAALTDTKAELRRVSTERDELARRQEMEARARQAEERAGAPEGGREAAPVEPEAEPDRRGPGAQNEEARARGQEAGRRAGPQTVRRVVRTAGGGHVIQNFNRGQGEAQTGEALTPERAREIVKEEVAAAKLAGGEKKKDGKVSLEELKKAGISNRDLRDIALTREGIPVGTAAFSEGGQSFGKGMMGIFHPGIFGSLLLIVIIILVIYIVLQLFPIVAGLFG